MTKLNQLMQKLHQMMADAIESVAVYGGMKPASIWGLHQPKPPKKLK